MKKILYAVFPLLILASCKSSKETTGEDANNKKIINVIINPITGGDSAFFLTKESHSVDITNKRFQQYLAQELTVTFTNQYNTRFYTLKQAKKESIKPDWILDLTMDSVDILLQDLNYASQNLNKRYLESGYGPVPRSVPYNAGLGNQYIYQTNYAARDNSVKSYVAVGQLVVKITDAHTGKKVYCNSFSNKYYWNQVHSYYTGNDLGNGNAPVQYTDNSPIPGKAAILNNLYMQFYPQIKTSITNLVIL